MKINTPWSSQHKHVFRGCQYSLSNSFAEPLTHQDLVSYSLARGDSKLVEEFTNHPLTYTPNGGSLDLRQAVADLYDSDKVTADTVVVFAGGQVALQAAALAFLSNTTESSHAIVFTPGYQSCIEAPLQGGCSSVTYLQRSFETGWQIDIQAVRAAIQPGKTKFLLLNEPYNPAGTLMSKKSQSELIALARQHDIVILCDEVYRFLEHNPEQDRLPAMAEAYENGLSAVSISKPWGGCGITIGWLAFQDPSYRQRLLDIMYFGTACPSRASEIQAIMTLRSSETILNDRNRPILLRNWVLLQDMIERKYPEWFEWVRPTAGAIAFVRFKGPLTSAELGVQLAERGISIKPAYCFMDQPDSYYAQFFRIGYGESIMPKALEKFIQFVEEHREEWKRFMKEGGT